MLRFAHIGKVAESFVVEDISGKRIVLSDSSTKVEASITALLELTDQSKLHDQEILVKFHYNFDTNKLCAQLLTIITNEEIIRLTF